MIATDRNCGGVPHHAAGKRNHFGGSAADIEQAGTEFALVLREARFGGGERFEHGIVDTHARAVYSRHDILCGSARGGHDVHVCFQALAHHADGVADVILAIEKEFLGKHVQNFAVFRQLHAAGCFDGSANVVALHVARTRANGDAAAAVDAAHVSASHADQGGFDWDADDCFGLFDRAANRANRQIQIYDLAFTPAL